MNGKRILPGRILTVVLLMIAALSSGAVAREVPEARGLALAESLLPPRARSAARLVARDTRGERTVRPGDGLICVSDDSAPGHLSLNCHHQTLHDLLALEREVSVLGLQGAERSRWLCEEAEKRAIVVPDGAMEITATLAVDPDGSLPEEMTVYYLLYLPYATTATVGIPDQSPGDASPWLHLAGTCRAHVMWFERRPVERDEAPTVLPTMLSLGRELAAVRSRVESECRHFEEFRYTGAAAAPWTEQTQIDCHGLAILGSRRKVELMFNEGVLEFVWILVEANELESLEMQLAEKFGAIVRQDDLYTLFAAGTVALRNRPPEILVATPEMMMELTGFDLRP